MKASRAVAWVEYGESVVKDAKRFRDAAAKVPAGYVQFFGHPQVLNAAAVYARAGYQMPRPIL